MINLLMKYITLIEGKKKKTSKVEKAYNEIDYHFISNIISLLWKQS